MVTRRRDSTEIKAKVVFQNLVEKASVHGVAAVQNGIDGAVFFPRTTQDDIRRDTLDTGTRVIFEEASRVPTSKLLFLAIGHEGVSGFLEEHPTAPQYPPFREAHTAWMYNPNDLSAYNHARAAALGHLVIQEAEHIKEARRIEAAQIEAARQTETK